MVHISKRLRMPVAQAMAVRLGAIALALLVCGIITTLTTGLNPLDVYASMFDGAFGTERKFWVMLKEVAVLLCVSLALTPAFRMRFWNLGGEGQVLMGALVTAACMINLADLVPEGLLFVLMLVLAPVAGALWAAIPALFKARWNTNETLFTLMMNYVATQLVAYSIIKWESSKGSGKVGVINQSSNVGWLPAIGDNKYLLIVLLVALVCVAMYVYLAHSKHGFEIAVVGESVDTARYLGIKVNRVIVRTLLLSGAVCGFTGFLLVSGADHTITTTLAGGAGFTGVMVAWLAKFNPFAMIGSSFLLVFMEMGADEISTAFGLNHGFGDILTGVILFFIIGSEFFINYKLNFQAKEVEAHV